MSIVKRFYRALFMETLKGSGLSLRIFIQTCETGAIAAEATIITQHLQVIYQIVI